MKAIGHSIEALESRIAPATLTGKILTYTDLDGDSVTVKFVTTGKLTAANFLFDTGGIDGSNLAKQQLQLIDLRGDARFDGANILVQVAIPPGGLGDGRVNIGAIDASTHDLGSVTIPGDLGRIAAGDQDATQALAALTVGSLGAKGAVTQSAGGTLVSTLKGPVGTITVHGDWDSAKLDIKNITAAKGTLSTLTVDGNFIGGSGTYAGQIIVYGKAGTVLVKGDLIGGSGQEAGSLLFEKGVTKLSVLGDIKGGSNLDAGWIDALGRIGTLKIGKSLLGGTANETGLVGAKGFGKITVGGDIVGGTVGGTYNAGQIFSSRSIGSINITGSIIGGNAIYGGYVDSEAKIGTMTVGGDLRGGQGQESGVIFAKGTMVSVLISGSITSGSGSLSGAIDCNRDIVALTVNGSITGTAASPVSISAVRGTQDFVKHTDITIGSLTVGGNVNFALIRAGFNDNAPVNPHAQIGTVSITGQFNSSSLIAGVRDVNGDGFGNADDRVISNDGKAIRSTIKRVTIGSTIEGTATAGDFFGIEAELVKAVSVNGVALVLEAGPHNDDGVDVATVTTDDFLVREVPAP